jgi:hypothetical protein
MTQEHQTEQEAPPQGGEHFGEAPIGEHDHQPDDPATEEHTSDRAGADREVGGPTPEEE